MSEDNRRKRKYNAGNTTVKGVFKKDDLDDSLSASDWCCMLENSPKRGKNQSTRKLDQPLNLLCMWDNCLKSIQNYDDFIKHIDEHLNDYKELLEPIDCEWLECSYKVYTFIDLRQHLYYHCYHTKLITLGRNIEKHYDLPECKKKEKFIIPTSLNGYQCEWQYCNEKFWTIIEFIQHLSMHVYNNPKGAKQGNIDCCWKGCMKKQFLEQGKLKTHVRTHTKERVIGCPTCGHLFANTSKYMDHRRRQLPINKQSYLCSQCSKSFPSERLLKDHMRLHINHYKCSMCEMTCPKPSVLAKHIRYRHMNDKPYACQHCNYRGVSKHNLDLHLRRHSNETINCKECNYKCRSAFSLERHHQKVHGKDVIYYECHQCQKRFIRGSDLTKHLLKKHNYYWPSGHSRFRYKEDTDGVYRLQTVRYETLDVTKEIIKGKTIQQPSDVENLQYKVFKNEPNNSHSLCVFDVKLTEKDKCAEDVGNDDTNDDDDDDEEEEVEEEEEEDVEEEEADEEEEEEERVTEQDDDTTVRIKEESIDDFDYLDETVIDEEPVNTILITISEVDTKGNIVKSEIIKSSVRDRVD